MFVYKISILVTLSAGFFVYINSAGLGSSCFYPSDCGSQYFACQNGLCKCDDNHIPDRDNKLCVVDILDPCFFRDKCYDANAECAGKLTNIEYGSCQCKKGYTLHERERICLAVIGNNCSSSSDCIEGTCIYGNYNYTQCFCHSPLIPNVNGTKCLPALNADCTKDNKCAREHAICEQIDTKQICKCDTKYKEATKDEEKETYCLAKLDTDCKNATDCADFGAVCKNETIIKNETTIKNVHPWYNFDWTPNQRTEQPKKLCGCGEGYVRHPEPDSEPKLNVSECLKVATNLNDTCVHSAQCKAYSGFGSECANGICKCKNDFYFDVDFNRCVRSCHCPDAGKLNEIIGVFKELTPALNVLAKNNNIDISGVLKKVENLSK